MKEFKEITWEEQLKVEGGYPGLIDFEMIGKGLVYVFKGLLGGKNSELFK